MIGPAMLLALTLASDPWTKTDLALEGAFVVAQVIDMGQTTYAVRRGARELNPLYFTSHPSANHVRLWVLGTTAANVSVAHLMPQKWRRVWIAANLACEVAVIARNRTVHVGFEF